MKTPDTFRCHVLVKGAQCPCEMTLANTFTYAVRTLDRKAKEKGAKVDIETLKQNAICPWHAKMFRAFRRDICKMEHPLQQVVTRLRSEHATARHMEAVQRSKERDKNFVLARVPAMQRAFMQAGIATRKTTPVRS